MLFVFLGGDSIFGAGSYHRSKLLCALAAYTGFLIWRLSVVGRCFGYLADRERYRHEARLRAHIAAAPNSFIDSLNNVDEDYSDEKKLLSAIIA